MKNMKIMAIALSAVLISASAYSCGSTKADSKGNTNDTAQTTEAASDGTDSEATTAGSEDKRSDSSTDKKSETATTSSKSKSSTVTTTTAKSGTGSAASAKNTSSSGSGASSSGDNSSSGNSSSDSSSGGSSSDSSASSSSGAGTSNSSSGSSSSSGTSSGGGSSGGSTSGSSSGGSSSSSTTDEETGEAVTYDAKITLGSAASFTGNNVSIDGSKVTVTAGGDYYISGSCSEGQIYVDTSAEEKVKLVLDGVSLSNSSESAIYVNEAKKCVIETISGTTSTISDNASGNAIGQVIFSNDTLKIKGDGTLNINSAKAHAIASDDDVIIEEGTLNISSGKTGISVHDDVTINGGNNSIMGSTNGIKSKGTININGGTTVVCGGTKEEKSSVYCASTFNYTGGYLFAAGNSVSVPTVCSNPYIVLKLSSAAAGGSNVKLTLDGTQYADFTPHSSFISVMMLAPEIKSGSSFSASVGGTSTKSYTVSDGQNLFS